MRRPPAYQGDATDGQSGSFGHRLDPDTGLLQAARVFGCVSVASTVAVASA